MDAIHDDDKGSDESLINLGMNHNQEGMLVKQHILERKFAFYLQKQIEANYFTNLTIWL